jgi:hypothetical protein
MTALTVITDADEHLEHVRTQLLADVAAGLHSLDCAAGHLDALLAVDREFGDGRDGLDIHTHLNDAIRCGRAAYAVVGMIIEKERP